MVKRHIVLSSIFAAGLAFAAFHSKPARAADGGASSLPCMAILCLAPYVGMGTDGGPGCKAPKEAYFSIRVIDPWSGFDAGLTSQARAAFLNSCPDAMNKATAMAENKVVGKAYDAP